ncbi:MAG: hypothetical protein HRU20_15270 [Pseudomonadales bacterium]|nr:hypothetical protein [Pseudomonadales bacterium]
MRENPIIVSNQPKVSIGLTVSHDIVSEWIPLERDKNQINWFPDLITQANEIKKSAKAIGCDCSGEIIGKEFIFRLIPNDFPPDIQISYSDKTRSFTPNSEGFVTIPILKEYIENEISVVITAKRVRIYNITESDNGKL